MWDKCIKAYNIFGIIKKIGVWTTGLTIMGMMFFITIDVLGRNFFSMPVPGNFEIVQGYLMPLISFPALAYAYAEGIMPRMDIIINKLSHSRKRLFIVAALIFDIGILLAMIAFSWQYVMLGFSEKTYFIAGLRLYPVYFLFIIVPISFSMIVLENIFVIIRNLSLDKAEMTTESYTAPIG